MGITVLFLLLGVVLGAAVVMVLYRPLVRRYNADLQAVNEEMARVRAEVQAKNEQLMTLTGQLAQAIAQREAMQEKLDAQQHLQQVQRAEAEEMQKRQIADFKNLANDILEEKSRQFKQTNKESLELLLNPFRENIEGFRRKVEQVYVDEAKQRHSLQEEIRGLNEMNLRMSREATNLTNALKGNSKTQGDWGEMILETILSNSNLVKGIHYKTQETIKTQEGANVRPDVVLSLPEGKQIVIDSKVSLTAYVAYTEAQTPELATRSVRDHLRSVRAHIDELGGKRYQELLDSPDFVIMFVPTEPAFLLALQQDNTLWSDAYNKKVIISSPTNLFALLKIVDDLWKRDSQGKNALAIADQGGKLYDKFVGFTETLADLGRSLSVAGDKYDKAMNQLTTGTGNLIARSERLRQLGVKTSKTLSRYAAETHTEQSDDPSDPAPAQSEVETENNG